VSSFAAGRAYRLALDSSPSGGPAGEQFGRGTGSSMEFQEFRDYQAGDDLRHVDWRAYARTETLTTRLYREEVAATLELVVDDSRSIALTPRKQSCVRQLTSFLAGAASGEMTVRALAAGEALHFLDPSSLAHEPQLDFDSQVSLAELPLAGLLRHGSVRIVISDFLFRCDPRNLLRKLAARAHQIVLIQVLDASEWQPSARGALRLNEVESGQLREIPVDDVVVARYLERLERHCQELEAETRRAGGLYMRVDSDDSLDIIARQRLTAAGVITPR